MCCRFPDHAERGGECFAPPYSATHTHPKCGQSLCFQRGQFQRHGTAASPRPREVAPTTTSADTAIRVVHWRGGVSRNVRFQAVLRFRRSVSASRARQLPGAAMVLRPGCRPVLRPGPAGGQAGTPRHKNFRGDRSYWGQWGARFPSHIRTSQEAVHLQVLQSAVHQVVQLADPRAHAYGRAALLVRHLREGVSAPGPPQGPQVHMFTHKNSYDLGQGGWMESQSLRYL
jgi:hypothetical protein